MDFENENDNPPDLVGVGDKGPEASNPTNGQPDDLNTRKVPITIVTEFGDSADIEKALTVSKDGQQVEEWLELGNGCICCSIKHSGVAAIESLMERSGTFDYILLETSGLAEPGNIAPLFWVDDGLGSSIYLDGIVTLVDAKNILRTLNETSTHHTTEESHNTPELTTAHLQISHADVVVVNKSDLVTSVELTAVIERVKAINALAKIHVTQQGKVPKLEGFLLDLHAYDALGTLDTVNKGHSHLDPSITTISVGVPLLSPNQVDLVDAWLRSILWDAVLPTEHTSNSIEDSSPSFEIHRLKGRLQFDNGSVKMVQGVREVFEILDVTETPTEKNSPARTKGKLEPGKIVLIGRGVQGLPWADSLLRTLQM